MYYISTMFDTVKMIDTYMSIDMWLECHRALSRVLEKLADGKWIKFFWFLFMDPLFYIFQFFNTLL